MIKQFKDLSIQAPLPSLQGDKIGIRKILNREVTVYKYEIKQSKYPEKGNGKCLYIQIEVDKVKRVVFTGSVVLQQTIEKIPVDAFPFMTKIVEDNERFEFT
jgi:hypothetical protein